MMLRVRFNGVTAYACSTCVLIRKVERKRLELSTSALRTTVTSRKTREKRTFLVLGDTFSCNFVTKKVSPKVSRDLPRGPHPCHEERNSLGRRAPRDVADAGEKNTKAASTTSQADGARPTARPTMLPSKPGNKRSCDLMKQHPNRTNVSPSSPGQLHE